MIYWLISQRKNKVLINKAVSQFNQSLKIDPTFAFSHSALGVIYAKIGLKNRAIKKFKEAVYYEPNYAQAHYNLALLYASQGLSQKAISECQAIIEIENKNLFSKVSCGYEKALLSFDYSLAHKRLGLDK
jgi:tetratricopeptide (TPR) repeat protein